MADLPPIAGLDFAKTKGIKMTSRLVSTRESGAFAFQLWALSLSRCDCDETLSWFHTIFSSQETVDWEEAIRLLSRDAWVGQKSFDGYVAADLGTGNDIMICPQDRERWARSTLLWNGVHRLLGWEQHLLDEFFSISGGGRRS
jgi:hypothetical protein